MSDMETSDNTITFVRPGCSAAEAAIAEFPKNDKGVSVTFFAILYFVSMTALVTVDDRGFVFFTALAGFVSVSVMLVLFLVRSGRRRRAYVRQVAGGNIVQVHRHIICVWDELRREHNVPLADTERTKHVNQLFDAAVDLRNELEVWTECEGNDELTGRRELAEARIRARLLHEVTVIKQRQETQRQLDSYVSSLHPAGVTDDEVAEQLAQIRARQEDPAATTRWPIRSRWIESAEKTKKSLINWFH